MYKYKIVDWANNEISGLSNKAYKNFQLANDALESFVFKLLDSNPSSFDWHARENEFYIEKDEYWIRKARA